jgi:hypothetical protein
VISEVSVARPVAGGIPFAEFIALMARLGFAVNDVLDGTKRGYGDVDFVDLYFRPV